MLQCSKCDSFLFHPRVLLQEDSDEKILQRLRSPAAVTEEDTAYVDQTLHDAESDLANYDAETTRLEKAVFVLKLQRQRLQDHVVKHRSLLSPIRRLPLEVLDLIFFTVCSGSGNVLNIQSERCMKSCPIVLSDVSTIWRRVVLESPLLWTKLSLRLELSPPALPQRRMTHFQCALSFFLQGSLQLPLSISCLTR
ncbi:hypothetical protein K435DRAFT_248245 [Dendrothele bispora CBS 962.96]|uniref:F-box domain-containing protein n=1 Tax=Dendrothele bispora (strain CBS 962.96) TaxID=1314807 RepID=A0A4S8MLM6_DENBC|nr:hypothetical protein K435DRAFT_248245 [Dendrothele bispora CBS 962.96]